MVELMECDYLNQAAEEVGEELTPGAHWRSRDGFEKMRPRQESYQQLVQDQRVVRNVSSLAGNEASKALKKPGQQQLLNQSLAEGNR